MLREPQLNSLEQWLNWLENLHSSAIDLGLERVLQVSKRLKLLKPAKHVVTVSGTNGKGSSVAMLEALYLTAGYQVGTYTSPHLMRYNERIRINGDEVTNDALCQAFTQIELARQEITLTYFEFSTLAALCLFSQIHLDIVILEVGLGGRLDATNIIDADIALLTSIGLDHQQWLGQDLDQIAYEKAGIFRQNGLAVYADKAPSKSIIQHADELSVKLHYLQRDYHYQLAEDYWDWTYQDITYEQLAMPVLVGEQQIQNAAAVIMVAHLLKTVLPHKLSDIQKALCNVQLNARCQIIYGQPTIVLDVAHNPDAMSVLAAFIKKQHIDGKLIIVFGMLNDKDLEQSISPLIRLAHHWHIAAPCSKRAYSADKMTESIEKLLQEHHLSRPRTNAYTNIADAYHAALASAEQQDWVLVVGSFITVAEVLALDKSLGL